jgi:Icc-related predicted phosphoesterase
MRITCISDIHGHLIPINSTDLLLIAGDLCPMGNHNVNYQRVWLDTDFRWWLKDVPAKYKVFIFGNHDFVGEVCPDEVKKIFKNEKNTFLLQDSGCEVEGIKIWGSAWTNYFYGWAFNLYEQDLKHRWDDIPEGTNILVTHGPPYGYGDKVAGKVTDEEKWPEPEHAGSTTLLERLKVIRPQLTCYGHIHSGVGLYHYEDLTFANCSIVNGKYIPVNQPRIFEWVDGKIVTPEMILDTPKRKKRDKT